MAKTQGKVTTTKSQFIDLAKGVNGADSATVAAWLAVFRAFVKSGAESKSAFAEAFVAAVAGTKHDTNTEGSIRVNLSHIEWAEANIIGGAKSCLSMSSIIKMKSGDFGKGKKPAEQKPARKVSTKTFTDAEFIKVLTNELVEAGMPKQMAKNVAVKAAKKAFITK